MLKRSSRRFLSILITCCMVFSSLVIINPSDVKADDEADVYNIWATFLDDGKLNYESLVLSETEPDGNNYTLFIKYITDGVYDATDDDTQVLLINDAVVSGNAVDRQKILLSGDSKMEDEANKITISSDSDIYPAYDGEINVGNLLAFYSSNKYEGDTYFDYEMQEVKSTTKGRNITADSIILKENIDGENKAVGTALWGYNIVADRVEFQNQDEVDEGFNGIVVYPGGSLTISDIGYPQDYNPDRIVGPYICLGKDATISYLKEHSSIYFMYFDKDSHQYTPFDSTKPHGTITFERRFDNWWFEVDFDPFSQEINNGEFEVDFDDSKKGASISIDGRNINIWESKDFEKNGNEIRPMTFDMVLPEGYDPQYVIVEACVMGDGVDGEDRIYDQYSKPEQIVFSNEDPDTFTWYPDSDKATKLSIYWSEYEKVGHYDDRTQFLLETKFDKNLGNISYVNNKGEEIDLGVEDPNNPGCYRTVLDRDISSTLISDEDAWYVTFTPYNQSILDYVFMKGLSESFYFGSIQLYREGLEDLIPGVGTSKKISEYEEAVDNGDGSYTLAVYPSATHYFYCEGSFSKEINNAVDVYNIWVPNSEGEPDIGQAIITDEKPDDSYYLYAKFITSDKESGYEEYDLFNDYTPILMLNNVQVYGVYEDHQQIILSGKSGFETGHLGIGGHCEWWPAFTGEITVNNLFEFYNGETYDNKLLYDYLFDNFSKTCVSGYYVSASYSADLSSYEIEDANGRKTKGSEIWAYNAQLNNVKIDSQDNLNDGFNGVVIADNGHLTFNFGLQFYDGALIYLGKNAYVEYRVGDDTLGKFYVYDDAQEQYVELDMTNHEPVAFEYRGGDWYECDFDPYGGQGPDVQDGQFIVDFDDRGGEASVSMNGQSINCWEPTDFEKDGDNILPLTFDMAVPEGYDPQYIVVSVGVRNEEDQTWYGSWDPEEDRIVFDNEHDSFTWYPDSDLPTELHIYWSSYDNIWPNVDEGEFIVETKAEADKATITFSPESEVEVVEDPNNPGYYKTILNRSIFENDGKLVFTITPSRGANLHDFEIRDGFDDENKYHYAEIMNEYSVGTFDECEFLTKNADGSYTLTITGDMVNNEYFGVEAWLSKIEQVNGIEVDARGGRIEFKFDDETEFTDLNPTIVGEGEGEHAVFIITPEDLDAHSSVTFRFTYGDGREAAGLYLDTYTEDEIIRNCLPLDNGEFTLTKGDGDWGNYRLELFDYLMAFDGTYTAHIMGEDFDRENDIEGILFDEVVPYGNSSEISFKIKNTEVYAVEYVFSNDATNENHAVDEVNGVYTIPITSDAGIDIRIYVTENDWKLFNLELQSRDQYKVEVYAVRYGFDESGVLYNSKISLVKEEGDHIVDYAENPEMIRAIVEYAPEEIDNATIKLNIDPWYNSVVYIFIGGNGATYTFDNDGNYIIDIKNALVNNETIEVIFKCDPRPVLAVDYPDSDISDMANIEYSFDNETYYPVADHLYLNEYSEYNTLYIKTVVTDVNFVCDGITVNDSNAGGPNDYPANQIVEVTKLSEDNWRDIEVSIRGRVAAGQFTIECFDEADEEVIGFNDHEYGESYYYFENGRIDINVNEGLEKVYTIVATSALGNNVTLDKDPEQNSHFFFTPVEEGGYTITVYTSEEQYAFACYNGDYTLTVDVSYLGGATGTVKCNGMTGIEYNGKIKFRNDTDEFELELIPGEGYEYFVFIDDDAKGYLFKENDGKYTVDSSTDVVIIFEPELTDARTDAQKILNVEYGDDVTLEAAVELNGSAVENPNVSAWNKLIDSTWTNIVSEGASATLTLNDVTESGKYECSLVGPNYQMITLEYEVNVVYKLTDNTETTAYEITKGDSVTLAAEIDTSKTEGDISYKWSVSADGTTYTEMEGSDASLGVTPDESGYYKCEVTDTHGSSVEVVFSVTVVVPELKDLTDASSKNVSAKKGDSVILEVKYNDDETTVNTFEWSKSTDGSTFTGATDGKAKLTFKAEETAWYRCKMTDKFGNVVDVTFKVTVEVVTPTPSTPTPATPTPAPSTPTPSPDPTKGSSDEESIGGFIERLYEETMGRGSDEDGKNFWTNSVESGERTGADCARGFLKSEEFHNKNLSSEEFLKVLYKTFFNREPDADGMKYWLGQLETLSQDEVVERFIDSAEWCNVCASYGVKSGATNAKATVPSKNASEFAERLYTECLGRPAEAQGLEWWGLTLTNLERTGTMAAKEFFNSEEFVGLKLSNEDYVRRLYRTFMGRDPESGGFEYWVGRLDKGEDRNVILEDFAACQEFVDICRSYAIDR